MRTDHGGTEGVRIDASVNVNPLGPPPALDPVFARARELASRYPEVDAGRARRAWAEALEVDVASVSVGNGASELISLAVRAIAPRRMVVFAPTYSEYEAAAEALGVRVERVMLDRSGEAWSTPEVELGEGDLVVVGQPNNPTGHLMQPDRLRAWADVAHVLVDESFLPFHPHDAEMSLSGRANGRLIAIRSLTKAFCVPGLRLGVAVAEPALVERMLAIRDPWSVNGIAAEAAVVLAWQSDYLTETHGWLSAEVPRFVSALRALPGLLVSDTEAPFVLCRLPEGLSVPALRAAMLRRGVGIRDASTFAGLDERWFRLGVRSAAENDVVLAALAESLGELEGERG